MVSSNPPALGRKVNHLHFEALEPRILFDAVPEVSVVVGDLTVAEDQLVNDDIDVSIQFDNIGDQVGYAPYVDIIAPPEVQINSINLGGTEQTNPNGLANEPIGEIATDGQLIEVGSAAAPVAVNHPMFEASIGAPTASYYGGAGSGTPPVTYDVVTNPALVGQYVYNVELPFGSYSQNNPALGLTVNASLNTADGILPNQNYGISAQGGFALGQDASDNPGTIVTPDDAPIFGAGSSADIVPLVMQLTKSAGVPEEDGTYIGELASGPNHPVTYTLSIDVATGETITGLNLTDVIPGDLAYLGNLQVTNGLGAPLGHTLNSEPFINVDGMTGTPAGDNTLDITFASVTGVDGTDITVTYEAFIPHVDGDTAALVVNPVSGEQQDIAPYNDAQITGTWGVTPVSDNEGPEGVSQDGRTGSLETDYALEEHSLAIQKAVTGVEDRNAPGNSPEDVLEYSMDFQVSDYFAFENLIVDDTLGDGQDFLPGDGRGGFVTDGFEIIPQLTFTQHGQTISVDFDSANYSAVVEADGTTTIQFDVYAQLLADHPQISGGKPVLGGLVTAGGLNGAALDPLVFNGGATTGAITYRVKIRDAFTTAGGIATISQGDNLTNTVTIRSDNLDIDDLSRHEVTVSDGSSAGVSIPVGGITKDVIAITSHGTTTMNPVDFRVTAGDLVSYRITYEMPLSEFEQFRFEDYLPLPIFDVATIDTSQVYDFDPATAYTTGGRVSYGPADTFYGPEGHDETGDSGIDDAIYPSLAGMAPTLDNTTLAASNGLIIEIGDYDVGTLPSTPRTLQFIITVEIQDAEVADSLQFTNQAGAVEANSFLAAINTDTFVQSTLVEPDLNIRKGVVATTHAGGAFDDGLGPAGVGFNAPGAGAAFTGNITSDGLNTQAIDANLSEIDAGDIVTFVITVENTGSSQYGAFDVLVRDTMPTGFAIPTSGAGLNLRVTDGNGLALTTTGDLFAAGLQLTDPSIGQGSLTEFDGASGTNIAIIAYDLVVENSVSASETLTNTAEILSYSHAEGGADHAQPGEHTDIATVSTIAPVLQKTLVSTSLNTAANDNTEAVIGEIITYQVTVTVPEGQLDNLRIEDQMDDGLAFVDFIGVTAVSPGLTSNLGPWANTTAIVVDPGAGANHGNRISLGFGVTPGLGTLTNANNDNSVTETITFQYRAVVLNHPDNDEGDTLNNSADLIWDLNGADQTLTSQASEITVREAHLDVTKSISNPNAMTSETVTYTFTVTNNGTAEAYDAVFRDVLPAQINSAANLQHIGGEVPTTLSLDAGGPEGTINATWASLGVGQSTTFSIEVTVDPGLDVNTLVSNSADLTWTSLPGDPGVISVHNPFSEERSGDTTVPALNPQNDYADSDNANFTVPTPTGSKAIIDTSEAHTSNDSSGAGGVNAAPGEIIRYEVTIDIPQGNMSSLTLVDTLEAGLLFLDPAVNNVTVRLNGFNPSGATYVAPDLPGNAHLAVQTLDPGRINVVGQIVTFDFGQLTNNEADAAVAESLTIAYNVIVSNDAGTNTFRGNVLSNSAQVQVNGLDSGGVATIDTTVVQPQLTITKSDGGVNTADAGDVISYTLTITADNDPNAATAFDLLISDNVPAELEILGGTLAFSGLPGYVTSSTVGAVGQAMSATVDQLRPGDTFDIVFDARVRDTGGNQIGAGETVNNTANLTYSSLPGAGTPNGSGSNSTGSVADTPGTIDGERVYTDSASEPFSSPDPTITKVLDLPADTTYTIGETVEYVITLAVPEGETANAIAVDVLEAGMTYLPGSLTVTPGAGISFSTPGPYDDSNAGFFSRVDPGVTLDETFTLDFGTIDFNDGGAGNGLATQSVVIRYTARVDNIVENQNADVRSNVVDLNWTDGNGTPQSTTDSTPDTDTDVTIVEPDLTVTKTITNNVSGLDAGDTVIYQIQVQHTAGVSTADAFDLNLSDALPASLLENLNLVSAEIDGNPVAGFALVGNTLTTTANVDLVQGEVLTITVTGQVRDDVNPGDSIGNTASLTWSGIDGVDPTERDGSDGIGGAVNDYSDSSTVNTPVRGVLNLTKTIPSGATEVLIDGTIGYQLEVNVAEGTLENLTIVDTLPNHVTLTPGSVVVSNANGMTISGFTVSQLGQQLTIAATSVLNPSDSDDPSASNGDSFLITYEVTVDDVGPNFNGVSLVNDADASADGVTDDLDNQASIIIAEPVMQLQKTLTGANSGDAGDIFSYTFTLNHDPTSRADAQDVILEDVVPAGFVLVPGSILPVGGTPAPDSISIDGTTTGAAGDKITLRWETIPETVTAANSYEVTIQFALVDSITDLDPNIVNSATLDYDQNPDDLDGRAATQLVANALPVDPDLAYAITKSVVTTSENGNLAGQGNAAIQDLVIGEEVTFELVATFGEGTTNGVIIRDTLPFTAANGDADGVLTYLSSQITGIGSGISSISSGLIIGSNGVLAGGSPDVVEFNLGDIVATGNNLADSTITIQVVARVANLSQNQNGDLLTNTGELSIYNGAQTFQDTAQVEVFEPEIVVNKSITNIPIEPDAGDTASYEITINNPTAFDAYEATFADVLPPEVLLQPLTFTANSDVNGDVSGNFTAVAGGITSNAPFTLEAGETITITYDGSVTLAVVDGQTYTNNVQVDWTSISGVDPNERTGDDGEGGGLNNYEDNTSASFVAEVSNTFAFDKVFVGGDIAHTLTNEGTSAAIPDLIVGETVTYQLVTTIGRGTTSNVSVVDQLDFTNGLLDIQSAVVTAAGSNLTSDQGVITGLSPVVSDSNADTFNDRVFLNLGTMTNNASSAVPADSQVIITIQALVVNDAANQDDDIIRNTGQVNFDSSTGPTSLSDFEDVEIVAPDLVVAKTITSATAGLDAADTVRYQIQVTHSGDSSADAFDLDLSDALPAGLLQNFNLVSATIGAADVSGSFNIDAGNNLVTIGDVDLAKTETLTLIVTAQVRPDANPGDSIDNTANLTWSGIDGVDPGERDGSGGVNDYTDSSSVSVPVQGVLNVGKTVVGGVTDVLVGDRITYRVRVDVAEGVLSNLSLVDTLPAGVSLDGGSLVVTPDAGISFVNFNTNVVGQVMTFTADSVTNANTTDDASNLDTAGFTIEYTIDISDDPVNVINGVSLTNDVDATADDVPDDLDNQATVTVREPVLQLDKSFDGASSTSGDAGTVVTYVFTINHDPSSGADAQDVILNDVVPAGFQLIPASITPLGGAPAPDSTVISGTGTGLAGETITLRWETIADTVTAANAYQVSIQFVVVDTITDLDPNIINSATLDYDQDPDDLAGRPATQLSSSANPFDPDLAYAFTKEVVATSETSTGTGQHNAALEDLVVGEEVTFELVATFGEGTTNGVVITDTLPFTALDGDADGVLEFVSSQITAIGAGVTNISNGLIIGSTGTQTGSDPDVVTFDFGNIVATGNNVADSTITIQVVARVANLNPNQDGDLLTNTGQLSIYNGAQTFQDTAQVEVVEPNLNIATTITSNTAGLDAGDTVTYQIQITNPSATSTADAFDLNVTDLLPDGFLEDFTLDSATIDAADVTGSFNIDGANDLQTTGNVDLLLDEVLTLTISGTVRDDASPADTIANTADVTWTSINDGNVNERDGADGVGGALDDYAATSTVNTVVQGVLNVTKSIPAGTTEVAVGDRLTYQLEIEVAEGELTNLSIVDTLPDGVTLNLASVQVSNANGMTVAGFNAAQLGQVLTITATSVTNPGNVDSGLNLDTDSFFITYEVQVNDDPVNVVNAAVLTNDADASADNVPNDLNNQTSVTVIEPVLDFSKVLDGASPTTGDAGHVFSYIFTVNHDAASTSDAFDVEISDVIPAGFELVGFAAIGATPIPDSTTISGSGVGIAGETITMRWETIPEAVTAGSPYQVRIQFKLVDTITDLDANITNSATLNYDSHADDLLGRAGTPVVSSAAAIDPDLAYAFTKGVLTTSENGNLSGEGNGALQDLVVGEEVTFQLVATFGEGTTTGVVITDTLPFTALNGDANGVLEYVSSQITAIGAGVTNISRGLALNSIGVQTGSDPDVITFDFGDILATGNNVADSTITIEVVARVANLAQNQDGDLLTNTGELSIYNGAQTLQATAQVEVFEADIVSNKSITAIPANPDAGDTVSYEVTITNPTSFTAYDSTFVDTLPTQVDLLPATFAAASNQRGVVTGEFTAVAGGVTNNAPFNLAAGEIITFSYNARINGGVVDGVTYTNNVQVDWTSISGANANERTGDDGEGGALDTYEDNSDASFVAEVSNSFAFDKIFVDGDATHTAVGEGTDVNIPDLVVGEVVTYQLVATIGSGTTANVSLIDQLDPTNGLLHIQSATVVGGSNLTSDQGVITGMAPVVSDANVDAYNDRVFLNLGTVTNSALSGAGTDSQVIVTVRALVVNEVANQQGDVITNRGDLNFDTSTGSVTLSDTETVEIVEPTVTVAKSIVAVPANPDAGDTVSYQIVIANNSGVDAFDTKFADVLPPQMNLLTGSFTANSNINANVAPNFLATANGVTQVGSGFTIEDGETITITYTATILATVQDGQDLLNAVDINWSSLPGADANERDGADGVGGVRDDYAANDDATVRSNLTGYAFTKDIAGSSQIHTGIPGGASATIEDLVIGETVTYRLTATVAEGTTPNVRILDNINFTNAILEIESVVISAGSNLTSDQGAFGSLVPLVADTNADTFADQMLIDFGAVTNNAVDGVDPTADQIEVLVTARVVNVIGNQDGDVVRNDGNLSFDDEAGTQTIADFVDVEIVEPVLDVQKTLTVTPTDAGDTISWQIVITHEGSSTADAKDVTFADKIPFGVDLDFATGVTITHPTDANVKDAFELVGGVLTTKAGGYDLDLGDSITINLTGVLNEQVRPNEVIANQAGIDWTSVEGVDALERGGDGVGPNDYSDTASAANAIAIEELAIDKRLPAGASITYSVGETVTFELEVTIMEGTTPDLILQDRLPVGLRYLSGTAVVDAGQSNPLIAIGGIAETWTPGTGVLTLNLGTVVNTSVNDGADDSFVITYQAVVENLATNQGGTTLTNDATADANDAAGNPLTQVQDQETVSVVEPQLEIQKTVDNVAPKLADTLTYTLTITNTGGAFPADAFDIDITDNLPAELSLNPASITVTALDALPNPTLIVADTSTPGALRVTLDRLDIGRSVELTFQADVTSGIGAFNGTIINNAGLEWTSTAGPNPNERTGDPTDPGGALNDYNDTDSQTVEVFQPDLRISKDDGGAVITPGGTFSYTLTVTNIGRADARNVQITDNLSEFIANGFTPLGSTPVGVLGAGVVTISLPDIPVGDIATATISLRAPLAIPAGLESITNTAQVTHLDIDPTPENNSDAEETPINAVPDLAVTKTDGQINAQVGDVLTYTLSYTNEGAQVASGVVLEDRLPMGIEFISASDGGVFGGGTVAWNLGDLNPGESGTVTVSIRVWSAGTVLNTTTITDDGSGGADPTPANNTDTDTTIVLEPPAPKVHKDRDDSGVELQFDTTQNFLFGEDNQRGAVTNRPIGSAFRPDAISEITDYSESRFERYFRTGENLHHRLPTSIAYHMNSGLVQPGSNVVLEVYNAQGLQIATAQTVADTGGNWVVTFQTASINEEPHRIVMRQTAAIHNTSDTTGYNFRTYFGPAYNTGTQYTSELTQQEVFTLRSAQAVLQIHRSSGSIIQLNWNMFQYEFISTSGLPGMAGG